MIVWVGQSRHRTSDGRAAKANRLRLTADSLPVALPDRFVHRDTLRLRERIEKDPRLVRLHRVPCENPAPPLRRPESLTAHLWFVDKFFPGPDRKRVLS